MAEERDPLVSRRYGELGSDEPPAGLDERILARSRRRPRLQWHGPLAAAAVIVLAVAVTVHVERDPPSPAPSRAFEASEPPRANEEAQQAKPYEQARPAEKPQRVEPPAKAAPAPAAPRASASREEAQSRRDAAREAAPQAPPPAAQEAPAQRALEAQRAPAAGAAADEARKPMGSLGKLAEQSPERWLEGIAELRAQGRHAEADESLKRFRERYPDYRISEEMKAKIEKN